MIVQHTFGLDVPTELTQAYDPAQTALLVYDMQAGIFAQAPQLASITPQVSRIIAAARTAGLRTFFARHMSLPKNLMGVSQLRTAMTWQRHSNVEDVTSMFLRDTPAFSLIPEATPLSSEMVFDKLGMSFFEGTPLNMVLRDCGITSFIIAGVVLEIGIVPTVTHGIDLGYMPIVVEDACGSVSADAKNRALEDVRHTGSAFITDTQAICRLITQKA
jgi:nicotinamidase-related amidase